MINIFKKLNIFLSYRQKQGFFILIVLMSISALHCVIVIMPNKQLSRLIKNWKNIALSNYEQLIRCGNKLQNKIAKNKLDSIPNPDEFIEKRKHCNKICIQCRKNIIPTLMKGHWI